ncbi:MAG: hypothetical protein H7066_12130 [Cytophagaceae bacterium]|nr:hypothetical protein [Gemmatimonadaceae bacterium]
MPPRMAELLLEGFGADPGYRDAMLGDLAEEFGERVDRDGLAAARRWYARETVRSVWPVVRTWIRGLGWRDARHLFGLAVSSWLLVAIPLFVVLAILQGLLALVGILMADLLPLLFLPLLAATGVAGGAVAGALHERAPLAAAALLGALFAVQQTIGVALAFGPDATWVTQLIVPPLMLACTVAGGLLRVAAVLRSRGERCVSASRAG